MAMLVVQSNKADTQDRVKRNFISLNPVSDIRIVAVNSTK
jgi:hypothetical protein